MTRSEAEGLLDPFGLEKNGVKKAFRKAALYWHPDHNGDAGVFAKMVEARDVLLGEEDRSFEDAFAYMMQGWGPSVKQQRYREYLCFYGRKGKFTFTVNGEKFDIFL